MSGDFSEKTKQILAKRAGERCSLCSKSTSKPHPSIQTNFINLGEAAHIKGNKSGKHNRYYSQMTDLERSDISNGIWLCSTCHKEIDSDSVKFTVSFLEELKRKHESRIYLGEFDVNWREFILLDKRVYELDKLIKEKELNTNLQNQLHAIELQELRIQLEKVRNDRNDFEKALDSIKNAIAALDIQNPTASTKVIIEAYKEGDIQRVKDALNEEKLAAEQFELSQKRLLKANVLEFEKDYPNAEINYYKAYALNPTKEYFEYYIAFLKRIGKNETAIQTCLGQLLNAIDTNFRIFINCALGEIFCHINRSKNAVEHFEEAKVLIEQEIRNNPDKSNLEKAKIYSALGIARKNIGEVQHALSDFQESLNAFWYMTNEEGVTHVTELVILLNSIGLLYLQNHDTDEALDYFLRAKKAFDDGYINDEFLRATVYLNLVDLYNYQKENNEEARKYIDLSKKIIFKGFSLRPLLYLQYYLGVLTKSADCYFTANKINEAREEYLLAIKVTEEFKSKYNVYHASTLTTVYFNYSLALLALGENEESIVYTDKAIDLYLTFDDSEHEKNFNLTKLYMFKADREKDKLLRKSYVEKAKFYILKCNDIKLVKIWKYKVELALQD